MEKLLDFRSCWIVFIHVVRGHPGGLVQFSKGEAVKIFVVCLPFVQCGRTGRYTVVIAECKLWKIPRPLLSLSVSLLSLVWQGCTGDEREMAKQIASVSPRLVSLSLCELL